MVKEGEIIKVKVTAEDKAIDFKILKDNNYHLMKEIPPISIELNEIVILNDNNYHQKWYNTIQQLLITNKNILDLTGSCSILSYMSYNINKLCNITQIYLDPFCCDSYKQYNKKNNLPVYILKYR